MKKYFLITVLLVSSCTKKIESDDRMIVTGIAPIASLIQEISGIATTNIIPNNMDPHTFQLKPSDGLLLAKASMIIALDDHLDGYFLRSEDMETFYLSEDHKDHDQNSHVWISYIHTKQLAESVLKILVRQFPEDQQLFTENYQKFIMQLQQSHQRMTDLRQQNNQRIYVVQRHPVWDYLLDELDIELLGTLEESGGVSLKKVVSLIADIKQFEGRERVILIDDAFSHSSGGLTQISEETGIAIQSFNPMINPQGDSSIIPLLESYSTMLLE